MPRTRKLVNKWLVTYNRNPVPAVEFNGINIGGPQQFYNQPLAITVIADTEEEAIAKATAQLNSQIKGGQYITTNSPPNGRFPRVGFPDIFSLASVKRLRQ